MKKLEKIISMKSEHPLLQRRSLENIFPFSAVRGLALILILLFVSSFSVYAQKRVTGNVKADDGQALPGVSIVEKGATHNAAITDADGNYSIQVSGNDAVLSFTFIGYSTKEVPVGKASQINVIMKEESKVLNEVVVVSYGTQKKKDLTGSITTVKADNLSDMPVGQIGQKIQGEMPGVQINQSTGAPGQGMGFRIRGAFSILSSNSPLFVLDGLPISTSLNNINPDEVESFTVLKDAAATSLYGSRAANGVILITTKKAKSGKLQADLQVNYGVQTVKGMNEMNVMNAHEFAQYKKEFYEDSGQEVPDMYKNPDQYGEGTNWYKLLTRDAPTLDINLMLSGGTDKSMSTVILGYYKQNGVILNSDFTRYSVRANNEFKLNNKVRIGVNIAPALQIYNNQNTDGYRQVLSAALIADPCQSPYEKDGSLKVSLDSPGMFGQPNWLRYIKGQLNNSRALSVIGNAFLNIDLFDGLTYKLQIGTDVGTSRNRSWIPSDVSGGLMSPPPNKATGSYSTTTYYNWNIENLLAYNKTFGKHTVGATVGYSAQKANSEWSNVNGTDYPDDDISWLNAAATITGSSSSEEWTMASMLGRIDYNYKDRYLFQANIRYDGCSRFAPKHKYATFPSFSVGWIASEEGFMKPLTKVMNYFKIRGSWGMTGNNSFGNYAYLSQLYKNNYALGGSLAQGKSLSNIGNNELTWEKNKQLNIGLDFGFFNDRIFITYDYYSRITDGLLYQTNIPWSSGFGEILGNVGRFDNWGHEINIESRNFIRDFKWKTSLNLTFARNKIKRLSTNNEPIGGEEVYSDWNRLQVGKPAGVFYGYVFDGVYMNQKEFDSQPKHASSQVGTARMKDVDKNGVITLEDRTIIGDPNPDMLFGITNQFSWKNFDLSIFLTGQVGGDVFLGSSDNEYNLDGVFNVNKEVKYRWRSLDNPGKGVVPSIAAGTTEIYRLKNSRWVYDASHLVVKNITIGYNIPIKKNNYISKARVYVSGQQLFVWKSYPGLNPEINNTSENELSWQGLGVDMTTYPIPRIFTLGFKLTF